VKCSLEEILWNFIQASRFCASIINIYGTMDDCDRYAWRDDETRLVLGVQHHLELTARD
jgi:hypothetical protein